MSDAWERDTSSLRPRKEPSQSRSRHLVAAIEEAAARIVREGGADALTVQALCSRAGVSPGSLYQYFPNSDAVLYALLRRHAEHVTDQMTAVLQQHAGSPAGVLIAAAVDAFIDAHRADPRLHGALGRVIARRAGPGLEADLLHTAEGVLAALLESRAGELGGTPPHVAAFLLLRTLEGLVHTATRDAPALLDDPAFSDGIKAMMRGLLR